MVSSLFSTGYNDNKIKSINPQEEGGNNAFVIDNVKTQELGDFEGT